MMPTMGSMMSMMGRRTAPTARRVTGFVAAVAADVFFVAVAGVATAVFVADDDFIAAVAAAVFVADAFVFLFLLLLLLL